MVEGGFRGEGAGQIEGKGSSEVEADDLNGPLTGEDGRIVAGEGSGVVGGMPGMVMVSMKEEAIGGEIVVSGRSEVASSRASLRREMKGGMHVRCWESGVGVMGLVPKEGGDQGAELAGGIQSGG